MLMAVPRTMESLAVLVDFVREFLRSEGLPDDVAFDMDLVIEELFTNLVRHAQGGGPIDVAIERSPGEIHISLKGAEQSPFDPTRAPRVNVNLPIEERRAGGLGIHFVRELCREFRYEWRDGVGITTVVMGVNGSCST